MIFLGQEERLILSHRADSRMIFARGALAAARFLSASRPAFTRCGTSSALCERAAPSSHGLARRLGLFDATMLVMGGIIGSGIFVTPAEVARHVDTPLLIVGVWVLGGIVALAAPSFTPSSRRAGPRSEANMPISATLMGRCRLSFTAGRCCS